MKSFSIITNIKYNKDTALHFIEVKKAGSFELIAAVKLFSIPQNKQANITNIEFMLMVLKISFLKFKIKLPSKTNIIAINSFFSIGSFNIKYANNEVIIISNIDSNDTKLASMFLTASIIKKEANKEEINLA